MPAAAIRISRTGALGRAGFHCAGTEVIVMTAIPARVATAALEVRNELTAVDAACSRSRPDSELQAANRAHGHQVAISPLLAEAVGAALQAAELTDGRVDPTTGTGDWRSVRFNRRWGTLQMPAGTGLDLGATALALAADRAAARASGAIGGGPVLVGVGGHIAVAGPVPPGGWQIRITGRPTPGQPAGHPSVPLPTVRMHSGGLATTSAGAAWRTVTVTAGSCVEATTATTVAVTGGESAVAWLESQGVAARLVRTDGREIHTSRWPSERAAA